MPSGETPFDALSDKGKDPPVFGLPERIPVEGPRVRPSRLPVALNWGFGNPLVVTVKVPDLPTVKVAVLAEVMTGAASTLKPEGAKCNRAEDPRIALPSNMSIDLRTD